MNDTSNDPIDWHDVLSTFTQLSEHTEAWLMEASKGVIDVPTFMNYNGDYEAWMERLAAAANMPTYCGPRYSCVVSGEMLVIVMSGSVIIMEDRETMTALNIPTTIDYDTSKKHACIQNFMKRQW